METFLTIDSTKGGNGDLWMRLVSFYAAAELLPELNLRICLPKYLGRLAEYGFGDRLNITTDQSIKADLTYTNLGIRHLAKPILNGKRFVSPYQRVVINDKKKEPVKDLINTTIFNLANQLGFVQIPDSKWMFSYQGYLDVIGIKALKKMSYEDYSAQLLRDYPQLLARFRGAVPGSEKLVIPENLNTSTLFFPNGTGRQFVPLWWAVVNMPDAYYAFFQNDKYGDAFEKSGLNVIRFHEPGDIIRLGRVARWSISTDSFPSHLLQSSVSRCTIVMTENVKSRIISPSFRGPVVEAEASCYPCLHMARDIHPLCAAGHKECINWQKSSYTANILNSVHQVADIS
jgi:hypothetical protein